MDQKKRHYSFFQSSGWMIAAGSALWQQQGRMQYGDQRQKWCNQVSRKDRDSLGWK